MVGSFEYDAVAGDDRLIARIAVDLNKADPDVLLRCRRLCWRGCRSVLCGGKATRCENGKRDKQDRPPARGIIEP
jgi:hypothetical protein